MTDALIAGAVVFVAVVGLGGVAIAVLASRRKVILERLQPREATAAVAQAAAGEHPFLRFLGRLGTIVSAGSASRSLGEQLAYAGYYSRSAHRVYMGLKVLLLAVGIICMALLVVPTALQLAMKVFVIMGVGILLFFVPNGVLALRRHQRRDEIRRHFPDAIDLMEICVSAGMGLDMAWNMVVNEVRYIGPTLTDEMALTDLEVHLGVPRVEAMKHMAERSGVHEVGSLATMMVQSERFGTSIAEALRTFANAMREDRSLRAQEAAEKAAVKMLFPLVVFVFPAVLAILVGPAAIRLAEMMRLY